MFEAGAHGEWWVLPIVLAAFVVGILIRRSRKKNGRD
jgi:Kef-type K+ transport system membrane component KefB